MDAFGPPTAARSGLARIAFLTCATMSRLPRHGNARSPIPGRASPVTPFCDPCQAFAGRRRRSSVSEAAACGTVLATVVPNHMAVRHFKQDKSDETRPRSLVFERVLAACRDWHSYAGSGVFAGVAGDGPRRGNHVRPNHRRTSLKQSPSSCFTQKNTKDMAGMPEKNTMRAVSTSPWLAGRQTRVMQHAQRVPRLAITIAAHQAACQL